MENYTVNESMEALNVCIVVNGSRERTVSVNLTTSAATAEGLFETVACLDVDVVTMAEQMKTC